MINTRLQTSKLFHGDSLDQYPDRQGWVARPPTEWLKVFENPSEEFVAFLERWLLFGPISTTFSSLPEFNMSDFVSTVRLSPRETKPTQRAYSNFTAARLPELLSQFRSLILRKLSEPGGKNAIQDHLRPAMVSLRDMVEINGRLSHAIGYTGIADDNSWTTQVPYDMSLAQFLDGQVMMPDPRSIEVSLATSVMLELLYTNWVVILHEVFFSDYQEQEHGPRRDAPDVQSVMRCTMHHSAMWCLFREKGWCPADMERLFCRFTPSCLYYIHNLARPRANDEHPMIRKRPLHLSSPAHAVSDEPRLCSTSRCRYRQLHDTTYTTQHAEGCQGCDDAVADEIELARILENNKLPLIMSIDKDDNTGEISFIESTFDQPLKYIAISHVWSDGLGNVQRNSIPLCQLKKLSKLVQSLPGPCSNTVYFWLDTICVPPDSAKDFKNAQQIALGGMRNVYQLAAGVLVLDSWLYDSNIEGTMDLEILVKIFSCAWNTRLWTFQEGVLAKKLYFQFSNDVYDLDDGFERLQRQESSSEESYSSVTASMTKTAFAPSLGVLYFDLRGFRKRPSWAEKLEAIASAFAKRTTSVDTDEALCIAVLLDMDVEKIARTYPPLRMQRIWAMLPGCPRQLIFTALPTFETPGLRWAARSFLAVSSYRDNRSMMQHGVVAEYYEDGVLFQAPGIHAGVGFGFDVVPLRGNLYVKVESGLWYMIRQFGEDCMHEDLLRGCTDIAFIDGETMRIQAEQEIVMKEESHGVVVRMDDDMRTKADGIVRCTRLFRAIIQRVTQPTPLAMLENMITDEVFDFANLERTFGRIRGQTGNIRSNNIWGMPGNVGKMRGDTGILFAVGGRRIRMEQKWVIR